MQQQRAAAPQQLRAATAITFDFETGDLRGWTATGNAFQSQPTYGDNTLARANQPANQQGSFWIGTFERHPRGASNPGTAQGDGPQGTLTSQPFDIPGGTLSFLIGGGSSFETRVELMISDQIEGSIRAYYASGRNTESMSRVTWDLSRLQGRRGFLRIVDESSGPWGHINVDDFRFSGTDLLRRPDLQLERAPDFGEVQVATTRVPDVRGRDLDTARAILERARLQVGNIAREPSRAQSGVIAGQEPEPRTEVRVGSSVDLTITVPMPGGDDVAQPVVVPDVVGRDERAALEILRAAGFQGQVVDRLEARETPGTVLRQRPEGGSRVQATGVVQLITALPLTARVPDLLGGSATAARAALERVGLLAGSIGRVESAEPEGTVVSQAVEAGTQVEQGTAVDFAVAVPIMRTVPDVVGRREADARGQLQAAGLRAGSVSDEESRDAAGVVLRQGVSPGSSVVQGAAVDLVVSVPMTAVVPDLVGLDEAEARRQVTAAELAVGNVVETESRREPGIIVTQSERAGSRVVLGTPIDMLVSVPVTVTVPDLAGRTVAEARGLLEGLELVLGSVASSESRRPEGSILSQQPGPGARIEIASAVDVVIAEPVTVLVPELVGFAEADARGLLQQAELTVAGVSNRESRQPVGTVLEQGVAAGERVVIGTPVSLVLAEPVTVLVPEVVGSAEADATAAVEAAELTVGEIRYQESPAAVGTVLTQSLNPGTRVQIGTPVNLLVAVVETVPVPELLGMSVEAAQQALVNGRLVVGTRETRESRIEPEGTVLEQSRGAGTSVAVGTPVNLVVATPQIVTVPSLVGLSEQEAIAAISGAGLVVGVVAESLSLQAGGTVLEQGQAAGSQVVFTTPISLQIARDRTIWVLPAGVALLLVAAAGTVGARRRVRRRPLRRPADPPEGKPPLPQIRARPVADSGRQSIDAGTGDDVVETEIRLRPIVASGTHELQSADELIRTEEREGEGREGND